MLRTESRLPSAKGTHYDLGTHYVRGGRNTPHDLGLHLMALLILAFSYLPWWGWLLLVLVIFIAIIFD